MLVFYYVKLSIFIKTEKILQTTCSYFRSIFVEKTTTNKQNTNKYLKYTLPRGSHITGHEPRWNKNNVSNFSVYCSHLHTSDTTPNLIYMEIEVMPSPTSEAQLDV